MKPPKCKNCGVEEWRHTCGVVPVLPTKAPKKAGVAGSGPPPFDRNAYQREYMRGYRAKIKAKKAGK